VFGVAPAIVQWAHHVAYVRLGHNASLTLNNNNNRVIITWLNLGVITLKGRSNTYMYILVVEEVLSINILNETETSGRPWFGDRAEPF